MTTENQLIPVPKNFNVTENFGELIIEFNWNRLTGAVMFIFSLIWNGMLIFMMTKIPPEFLFVTFIHAGVGLFLLYFGLCNLLNKTTITCDNQTMKLKSGPLPAFNNKTIAKENIQQLYFTEVVTRNKNTSTISYRLHMLDLNNRSTRLIKTLPDTESARFIESKLEKFFKIKDMAVSGEFGK
ncbi:MAG: hypothetical protein Q8M29_15865 [Bacteroidota bacterium]|nr:hypothetical protein [Bacteroidota bacterium]